MNVSHPRSLCFACLALALPSAASAAPVEVAVGDQVDVDLGAIWVGETREVEVHLVNPGITVHRVRHVTTSCGCTDLHPAPTEVPARGAVDFTVAFTAPEEAGRRISSVTVIGLPPEAISTQITLEANVQAALELYPEFVDFGSLSMSGGASREATVRLINLIEEPVTVTGVASSSERLTVVGAEWPLTVPAGATEEISVAFTAGEMVGLLSDTLRFTLDHPHQSHAALLGRADVLGLVQVEPTRLWYGFLDQGSTTTRSLTLTSREAPEFQITGSHTDQPGVSVETRAAGEGRWVVDVTLETAELAEGFVESTLTLGTDLARQPEITVDLLGAIRAP